MAAKERAEAEVREAAMAAAKAERELREAVEAEQAALDAEEAAQDASALALQEKEEAPSISIFRWGCAARRSKTLKLLVFWLRSRRKGSIVCSRSLPWWCRVP